MRNRARIGPAHQMSPTAFTVYQSSYHAISGQNVPKADRRLRGHTEVQHLPRLNANSRLSTALPTNSHLHNNLQTFEHLQRDNWASTSYQSQQQPSYQSQFLQQCSTTGLGLSTSNSTYNPSTTFANNTAMTATAIKFEQAATNGSSGSSSNGFGSASTSNWPAGLNSTTEWEQLAAAAIGRGTGVGLDSRMINTPPYYNAAAANYATNAAYLYGNQSNYGLPRNSGGVNSATSFPNYFATSNPVNSLNYAVNYGSTNLADYYGFNYYSGVGNSAVDAFASTTRSHSSGASTSGYPCHSTQNNSYDKTNTGHSILNNSCDVGSDLQSISLQHQAGASQQHQLSPTLGPSMVKTEQKPKRAKKRKLASGSLSSVGGSGGASCSPLEPNNTRVFIWELEDLVCFSMLGNPYASSMDANMLPVVEQILKCAFLLDGVEDCEQTNIEDAEIDDNVPHHNDVTGSNHLMMFNNSNGQQLPTKIEMDSVSDGTTSEHINQQSPSSTGRHPQHAVSPTLNQQTDNVGIFLNNAGNLNNSLICAAAVPNGGSTMGINQGVLEGLRRIATKYQHIRATYDRYKTNLADLLDCCGLSASKTNIAEHFNTYDKLSGCKIERYRRCLKIIYERSALIKDRCTNIVITNETLASSLAKLLAFDMAEFVQPENIYSTIKIGKEAVLTRICERFKKQHAVIITSSSDLNLLAKRENIPCWKMQSLNDIDAFYFALDTILLADTCTSISTQQDYLKLSRC
ncbi:eyes absent like protein 1 [Ditylenchus destructor]|nr:eyes absent like protein 1 [Ditylenchus destructor]